jgi:RimJ/RimL family protein N-acetyltransferase
MTESSTTAAERPSGSEGQTFLIGETLYLRGMEKDDAKRAGAWRGSLFPVAAARAEEIVKEDTPAEAEARRLRLIACRRADDEPIGAAILDFWGSAWSGRAANLSLTAAPALGQAGQAVKAEVLGLVAPWVVGERHFMMLHTDLGTDETEVVAAAEAAGMRPAARLREALWRDGARHDRITYELLNPDWLARLGDPGAGVETAGERGGTPHRRPTLPADAAVPPTTVMAGERVVLRPLEVEDAEPIARWSRQETETFFDNGRYLRGPLAFEHWVRKVGEKDPPGDIEFAIALRDGGELIGENGLYGIDWVHRTAETGTYVYRLEHRGGGYGSEAKHLLLAYAFDRLGLHMVRSYVWSLNTRSAAALRKQGYRDAGRIRWTGVHAGEFADALVFDLLADEWRAGRQEANPTA